MPLTSSNGLQIVVAPSPILLAQARVWNGKSIVVEQDRHLRTNILRLRGEVSTTKLQIPRDDRPISSLAIGHSLVVLQVLLDNSDHFAVEFTISQSAVARMKLIVGTQFKEAQCGSTSERLPLAKLPLIIPRGKWVQVVLHVKGIVSAIFNMGTLKCIDAIGFCGTARIAKVLASSDEQSAIDCAPSGMVLFAVPAYAPPIWTTASAPIVRGAGGSPRAQPPSQLTNSEAVTTSQRAGGGAPTGPTCEIGVMGISLSGSGTSPTKTPRGQSLPPRLQPIDARPYVEMTRPLSESGSVQPGNVNWPPNGNSGNAVVRLPLTGQSPLTDCKYVRFIESDDAARRSQVRGQLNQNGGGTRGGTSTADTSDISGWEGGDDDEPAQTDEVDSPFPPSSKPETRASKQSSKPKSAAEERLQRLIASRKHKIEAPVNTRRPVRASEDEDVSSPVRRRRLRAKRRMHLLRQNEQRSAKQSAFRDVQPSDLLLNRNVTNFEDGTARNVEDGEPVCGYGFGYLGLIHEDGSYETEEGADTRLKGALTLELSGDLDSGE